MDKNKKNESGDTVATRMKGGNGREMENRGRLKEVEKLLSKTI